MCVYIYIYMHTYGFRTAFRQGFVVWALSLSGLRAFGVRMQYLLGSWTDSFWIWVSLEESCLQSVNAHAVSVLWALTESSSVSVD